MGTAKGGRPTKEQKLPPLPEGAEPIPDERAVVRKVLTMGHRDALGFLDGPGVPILSSNQKHFLGWYLECGDEEEALNNIGVSIAEAMSWKDSPGFMALFEMCSTNPREGYKLLTGQLLGGTYRVIAEGLQSEIWQERMEAAKLASRTQGLLVDKVGVDTADALTKLMELLREKQPIQVIDMTPRD